MPDGADKKERSGIQVIARAALILRVLKENRTGLSLGQIATRVDLARSTVQRITSALAAEGLVSQAANGAGIRLGPELGALAKAANFDIAGRCRFILDALTRKTDETADLAMLSGHSMVFLDQVTGNHRLKTVSHVGDEFPITTTANGRACLALMSDGNAKEFIESEWHLTGKPGDLRATMAQLNEVRETGLAYDFEEHSPGISAIGIAFRDSSADLYAISVPVPSTRFGESRSTIEEGLREAKQKVDEVFSTDRF